jgi:DHA3 family macrolide efflux protein-like MFS transporter
MKAQRSVDQGMKVFFLIWFGQLISIVGSGLTSFALGVWVYLVSGSVTQYAIISTVAILPTLIITPFAGALVDRHDRRAIMILSDAASALNTAIIALLAYTEHLALWNIYIVVSLASVCSGFRGIAFNATLPLLVPRKNLGRATGLAQLAGASSRVISPMLAGFLMLAIKLQGILLLDLITFAASILTLVLARIPRPIDADEASKPKKNLLSEAAFGWEYIKKRRALRGMFIYFALCNIVIGIATVLFTPLVLSFASTAVLGTLLSIGGIGMIIGSMMLSIWGGPEKKVNGLLVPMIIVGASMILVGVRPSASLIAVGAFAYFFAVPILTGSWQVIIQRKVEPSLQGRVFAIALLMSWSSLPFAYLVAAPLVDRVFDPLLSGPLAATVGGLIGVGPGRGIGLLLIVLGILTIAATIGGYLYTPLRLIDTELPDAGQETAASNDTVPKASEASDAAFAKAERLELEVD